MTLMACYGGPPPPQESFAPCDPAGASCISPLSCQPATEQPASRLCTTSCSASTPCPSGAACVLGSRGGQCYASCQTNGDCRGNATCGRAPDGTGQICVPDPPNALTPYATCPGFGNPCGMGTRCQAAPGGVTHCTRSCASDGECPYQGVCEDGQCFLPCGDADAGPRCSSLSSTAGRYACTTPPRGTREVCVPTPLR